MPSPKLFLRTAAIVRVLRAASVLFCGLSSIPSRAQRHSLQEVLVVFNANSPISTAIAGDYAAKRKVPNMVAVHCADSAVNTANETISIELYTSQIASPISAYLAQHKQINFIVLTKGIPIR
jgi:acetate kinase